MNENAFFQYKETRAKTGYKSAWLIKDGSVSNKYVLLVASETVPYVFGEKESHEFNILQSPVMGQVSGKLSLETQTVEVLHHRDNAYRFHKLGDKTYEFMCINAEYMGYKFTGTVSYKPNSAEGDINKATVTITPTDASVTPVFNARGLIAETLCIDDAIPDTVSVNKELDFTPIQIGAGTLTFTVSKIEGENNTEQNATTATDYTVSTNKITFKSTGLFVVKVSSTNYAPYITTIYVEQ